MFSIKQTEEANAKVSSGDDFPQLTKDLADMGVTKNVFYVSDGHAEYLGDGGHSVETPAVIGSQSISGQPDQDEFVARLRLHQSGGTDFLTFLKDAAETGIEKWTIDLAAMTCTYYDRAGNSLHVEQIPQVN